MYKVGDEVLIKGEIKDDDGHGEKQIKIKGIDGYSPLWIDVYELIPSDKAYSDGLNDAWELAKKIYDMKCETIEQIFGVEGGFWDVIRDFTYEEALAKIEAYEKEKGIKVGSIVKVEDETGEAIVTSICPTGIAYVMWKDGSCGDYMLSELEITGRTAEGLDVLLRQIKE